MIILIRAIANNSKNFSVNSIFEETFRGDRGVIKHPIFDYSLIQGRIYVSRCSCLISKTQVTGYMYDSPLN